MKKGISKHFFSRYKFEKSEEYKKDIMAKARFINNANKRFLKGKGRKMLDVGFGNAPLIPYLKNKYDISGVDISKENVAKARENYPELKFFKADMRKFKTDEKYDMIVSICAIDHGDDLRKELEKTIKNMANHLNKSGIIMFDNPLSLDSWQRDSANEYDGKLIGEKGTKYSFLNHRQCGEPKNSGFTYSVSIKANGKGISAESSDIFTAKYLIGVDQVKAIAKRNGLKAYVYDGWEGKSPKGGKFAKEPVFILAR